MMQVNGARGPMSSCWKDLNPASQLYISGESGQLALQLRCVGNDRQGAYQ